MTFRILVAGTLNVIDNGQSSWQLHADLGGGSFDINASGNTNPALGGYSGDPFGVYTATVTVQLGSVAPLDVELSGTARDGLCGQPGAGGA
ncbi:MAG TPA: hypothetical protein VN736_08135 [Candidatus Limnocylindrales bacterium]|nr:hypothetical protein [Candidatus Limnocylindrales bacterium]